MKRLLTALITLVSVTACSQLGTRPNWPAEQPVTLVTSSGAPVVVASGSSVTTTGKGTGTSDLCPSNIRCDGGAK